jgi:hypothetical protein
LEGAFFPFEEVKSLFLVWLSTNRYNVHPSMKLPIRGNSIRLRLTQSEVARVAMNGSLESQTVFGARAFRFALVIRDDAFSLSASFDDNAILVSAPGAAVTRWAQSEEEVGL